MFTLDLQITEGEQALSQEAKINALKQFCVSIPAGIKNILLLPPDYTRKHSGAGELTNIIYQELKDKYNFTIMPALGTHSPMTEAEIKDMFGNNIPLDLFVDHKWRQDTVFIGEIPAAYVSEVSGGVVSDSIKVMINKRLVSGGFDLIISIGQVLPHEVVGMANYNKNIFVGCGGSEMINKSHFVGAAYGMEKIMGRDYSPVRKLYDYAENNFLSDINLQYILSVNSTDIDKKTGNTRLLGLFMGNQRSVFEKAVKLSQQHNITRLEKRLNKVVVYLDSEEFKSTWLGCKAIYRTRMAIANGGELIIIAPGLKRFGEDDQIDSLIRKYGYAGRLKILEEVKNNEDLRENRSAAAHLIHGSSDGRFKVTYASGQLTEAEITGANFHYLPLEKALEKYNPAELEDGYNKLTDGEEIYYISNPATGLWMAE